MLKDVGMEVPKSIETRNAHAQVMSHAIALYHDK